MNYKELGFKCGLEIHQQLETGKLFSACPSIVHDKNPTIHFSRKLRAVIGETGKIDTAAAHESQKQKTFLYDACKTSTSLVETDEEPPHNPNEEAVNLALTVAKMLNVEVNDEIHFMRKTVVDGSNVSGFQRTALIGINGYIETSKGKVPIPTMMLEEESAQKTKDSKTERSYRLDRLGVPLLEIATDASIQDPEHAKECATIIGMILRSTGKVKRGIGTIRQDVNISIRGGARTEIKGFQDLKSIPKVIAHEIQRQQSLIKNGKKIAQEVRKAEPDFTTSFLRPIPGAARLYPETDVLPLKITKEFMNSIKVPELLSKKKDTLLKSYNLNESQVNDILKKEIPFQDYATKYSKVPSETIAQVLIDIPKEIESRLKLDLSQIFKEDYEEVLDYLNKGQIQKHHVIDVLQRKIEGKQINLEFYKPVDENEIESEVIKLIKEKPGLNMGGYMGLLMAKFKGKADGKVLSSLLKKHLK